MVEKKKLKEPYKNFEETLLLLLEKGKAKRVSIKTFLTILSGKGRVLLLVFLSLGFGQVPGISSFFGLFIGYLGLKIAFGRSFVWMPKFVLQKKIPSCFLIKVIQQSLRLLKFINRWSRPRYTWVTQRAATRVANGLVIALTGLFFAFSPPVPLSGTLASVSIFLIAIGLLNDDGVYIGLGYFSALLYFIETMILLHFVSLSEIWKWIQNHLL